ncbi:MAG TPA: arginine--tRNA ligase [Actinomycetota bacterium]|nr:arginine--tRNA ligase [Actinomycetota bacterium]
MITDHLTGLLEAGLGKLRSAGTLPDDLPAEVELSRPARPEHGEFATNLPLALARGAKMPPRALATQLIAALPESKLVEKAEVAGPGFINFHLTRGWLGTTIADIAAAGPAFGRGSAKAEKVQIEFVSANPTGPLHVGSGRNAAYGDSLARLMAAAGYQVSTEYYVNDAGKQMERFSQSLHARYLQALGQDAEVPEDGYRGEYLAELGRELAQEYGDSLAADPARIGRIGTERMVASHRRTLERFRVHFDGWKHESSLHESGQVKAGIAKLTELGHTFEKEGALWFRSSELGSPRDQVLVRSDDESSTTYLAADVAYLLDKVSRGFDRVIYVWGADHHGNVAGLEAVARALRLQQPVEIKLQQLVNFMSGGEAARMSKRAGTLVTIDELLDEVGVDAARFTLVSRSIDSTIDFDLELVKSQSQENPVYYVQYQHARTCSILRNAADQGVVRGAVEDSNFGLLSHEQESALIRKLAEYPDLVEESARLRAPHRLVHYSQSLAAVFSAFYRDCRVLSDDADLSRARLWLVDGTRQVLANTLDLLGVSAPETM